MSKIIGNTTATPVPRSDWAQADETKVDHIKNKPHLGALASKDEITLADIGLENVNNTSDVNKPVSTAQRTAIDTALSTAQTYTDTEVAKKAQVQIITWGADD